MDIITDYLKQYPYYTKVLVICFAVLVVIIAAIFILRAVVNKKRNAAAQNKIDDFTPEKNQTDDFTPAKNEQESVQEQEQEQAVFSAQTSSRVAIEPQNKSEEQAVEESSGELESCWKITEQNGVFFAYLVYGEEILLSTSGYSSLSGVKSGIDTLKNNLQSENYAINVNQSGEFYFKVFSTANRLLCTSAGFPTRERCEHSFSKCKKASFRAPIVM